jgi:hypothetical protein
MTATGPTFSGWARFAGQGCTFTLGDDEMSARTQFVAKNQEMAFGIFFFGVYILGGTFVLGGLFLIAIMNGQDLMGWGDGRGIGYLFFGVGLCLSIAGILALSALKNRGTP